MLLPGEGVGKGSGSMSPEQADGSRRAIFLANMQSCICQHPHVKDCAAFEHVMPALAAVPAHLAAQFVGALCCPVLSVALAKPVVVCSSC